MQASKQAINLDNSLIYISYQRIKILIIYLHRYLFEFSFFFFYNCFQLYGIYNREKEKGQFFSKHGLRKGVVVVKEKHLANFNRLFIFSEFLLTSDRTDTRTWERRG